MEETFTYDDMNRLTGITLKRLSMPDQHCSMEYDALGRMTSKQVVTAVGGEETPYYILKDNLGSWTAITDGDGAVEQQLSYDAWGSLRDPVTWENYPEGSAPIPMFDRGFTGHEHLTPFGLINMNGRMYDPVMSSFLSADRFVQNPLSAQGFNRYAYCMYNPLRFVDPTGWLAGGGVGTYGEHPLGVPYYVNGMITIDLPEVTILADNPSLSNTYEYEEFEYTPNISSGGFDNGWGHTKGWSSGKHRGGSGGGRGKYVNNSPIKYMLLDYHQKYHHHTQTDTKGCKIATARSYYQYFSGKDQGESYFSTLVGGMIAVDKDTYLLEYYEACGLNVMDGMNVTILDIGHQLEEGHPYSIVLKGEHMSDIDHVVTMVGIYKENADSSLKVFIKDPMQQDGQYYKWVDFQEDIKDAYFITGLRNH